MKPYLPLLLLGLGVFLIAGGFAYDVLFAGIPYQDPTPEMSARYAHHAHVASTIEIVGGSAFLLGTVFGLMQLALHRIAWKRAT